jgi:hypothetical protein
VRVAVIKGKSQAAGGKAARADVGRPSISGADEQGLLFGEELSPGPQDVG